MRSLLLLLAFGLPLHAQLERDIDPTLAHLIASTPAFDNHAHPPLPTDPADRNFDALPVDNMEPQTDPLALRPDFPALHDAWLALYNTNLTPPLTDAQQHQLDAARHARLGLAYDNHVLDAAGIRTQVANRVVMGPGVQPPRFLWVPYDDALLFPLNNRDLAAATPDRAQFFPLEQRVRARYLAAHHLTAPPATYAAYLEHVLATLREQKAGGAIAIKFELAYLRPLDIDPTASPTRAAAIYERGIASGQPPSAADYKLLQDALFHAIAVECGRLGLAVHFHAMAGAGSYFPIAGVSPLNLEPLFNDPTLRHTHFVLLHGGFPFVHEIGALMQKPNAWLDLSQQSLLIPARTLAAWLREWLELYPEKILFATDGYPYSPALGWEESTWLAARNQRQALGLALTGMMRDGEVTPARAAALAEMVLHKNAEALYASSF